jgi:hypothetical protein
MKIRVIYPKWNATLDRVRDLRFETPRSDRTDKQVLSALFAGFGNHPEESMEVWRKFSMRSMSVGDCVQLDDKWYQCANVGWKEVSEARVDEITSLPFYDVWMDATLRSV